MTEPHLKTPEIYERNIANTPMNRYGQIDELKGTLVFLASQASSFATGSIVTIDGGYTIWSHGPEVRDLDFVLSES
jgi:galactitol 2-dehydrogenase (L-tagatose-forming)